MCGKGGLLLDLQTICSVLFSHISGK